jgi:hypothetical protein
MYYQPHLIIFLNKAIDQVRRQKVKNNDELKNTRLTLPNNPEVFTGKKRDKYNIIANKNYQANKPWQLRKKFKELFSCGKF